MHGSFFSHHFYHKWVTSDTHKDYHDVSHNQEDICCVHPHCKSKRCGTYIKLVFLLFQWIWTLHQQMLFSIFLLTRCFSHLLYPQLRHLVWQFHHSFSVPMSFLSGCFRYQTLHGFISLSQVALSKVASSFLLFLLKKDGKFCENLLVVEIDGNCSYLPLMSFLLPDVSMLFLLLFLVFNLWWIVASDS